MSRPSAKLCAEYLPTALKPKGLPRTSLRPSRGTRSHIKECRRGVHQAGGYGRRQGQMLTVQRNVRPQGALVQSERVRGFATEAQTSGPLAEYDARVEQGRLRDDPYQRKIIQQLQDLYEVLKGYNPPKVIHPTVESLDPNAPKGGFFGSIFGNDPTLESLDPNAPKEKSFFGSLFGGDKKPTGVTISEDLPKGLYMYGDVGCGKTMLMDLFYDTLPSNIPTKQRIHFHNFMQDVHKRLHKVKIQYGSDFDALPLVAADIAEGSSVLCFDEFQCTDVADAMILRRLLEILMSHGVVLVTTSNRHPNDLYMNGIQRESFIPCIKLLQTALSVINLNSPTDYRKIPRPPSGVYHHPLGPDAEQHVQKWFDYLGDPINDPPHPATQEVWGRKIHVPLASGRAAQFPFKTLLGSATGAADYIELVRNYDAFIVTDVPGMTLSERDLARRFITFIDAVYEGRAKLVLTSAVPISNIFMSENEVKSSVPKGDGEGADLSDAMRMMMDDLGLSMQALKSTSIFSGDEERFAFARALSRLSEMGSKEWVERGLEKEA